MNSRTDQELLRDYGERRSEAAFAELVQRHLDLVYSAALRMVRDAHLAEDVSQAVFVALGQNARQLTDRAVLSGWLHRTAQNLAANAIRSEVRRRAREQEAAAMTELLATETEALWGQIAPHLDTALGELSDADRDVLMLRYFEHKSAHQMAQTLGVSDEAAQKRVSRAVERLRDFFAKRGITVGAGGFMAVLSANAVQAAPIGLAATIATAAAAAGTTIATTSTLTTTIAMTTLQKTLVAGTLVAAIGAGVYEARQAAVLRNQVHALQQERAGPMQKLEQERDEALSRLKAVETEMTRLRQDAAEILKLRAEVARLRSETQPAVPSKADGPGGSIESTAKAWVDRVARLKQRLEQTPHARIPELQLLDDEDWLAVVKGRALETDTDYRRALSAVRNAGENKLASQMQKAVRTFMRNNNEQFPTQLAQLQSYFEFPIDTAILERWEIAPGKTVPSVGVGETIITQKAPIDEVFDTRLVVGSNGGLGGSNFLPLHHWATMKLVYEAYRTAHNGQSHTDFPELLPYATTPEQQAALQKMILLNSGSK